MQVKPEELTLLVGLRIRMPIDTVMHTDKNTGMCAEICKCMACRLVHFDPLALNSAR